MRRLSIATVVAFLVGGAIWLGWWHLRENLPGSVTISAASQPSEVTLRAEGDPKTVYALEVSGSGKVTGEAQIALILNGRPYKTERLNDSVNFTWGGTGTRLRLLSDTRLYLQPGAPLHCATSFDRCDS